MNKTTEALKLAEEALERLEQIDGRYSWGHALDAIREALAEPVKQELVAVISESAIGFVKLHSNGVSLPFGTPLYAAPVDAKAIRAEAFEEAAKWFAKYAGADWSSERIAAELEERAAAIRGLK